MTKHNPILHINQTVDYSQVTEHILLYGKAFVSDKKTNK